MTQQFFIDGKLPGLNDIIAAAKGCGGRGIMYAKMKAEWGAIIQAHIMAAKLQPMERAMLRFDWHEANARRDLDNVAAGKKFVGDALVASGVLPNDGWAHVIGFVDTFVIDKARPGVLVTLESC